MATIGARSVCWEDAREVLETLRDTGSCFRNLKFDKPEATFTFEYNGLVHVLKFNIDTYPAGTAHFTTDLNGVLTPGVDLLPPELFSNRLSVILEEIAHAMQAQLYGEPEPSSLLDTAESVGCGSEVCSTINNSFDSATPAESEEEVEICAKKSKFSSKEVELDACDYDEETDSDGDAMMDDEPRRDNIALKRSISATKRLYGDQAASLFERDSLDVCDVTLRVDMSGLLSADVMKAWGLTEEPLSIALTEIDYTNFRSSDLHRNNIRVYYESCPKRGFLVGKQIENIVKQYIRTTWLNPNPSPDENIWLDIHHYVKDRVPYLNEYCVICDKRQAFSELLMPSVCGDPLCTFSFETVGVIDFADEWMNDRFEVVNLLMAMFASGANSSRLAQVLVPFPQIGDPNKKDSLAISDPTKDHAILREELRRMPCPAYLKKISSQQDFKDELAKLHKLSYPFIRWIISSNRSHLSLLPEEDQFEFMNTKHQFLMRMDSPAKETAFRAAKAKYGGKSLFAFHGSPSDNWHSILRRGLINASNTPLMRHGAAHGNGIYLSPTTAISNQYSHMQHQGPGQHAAYFSDRVSGQCPANTKYGHSCVDHGVWLPTMPGSTVYFIAICEVVENPQLKKASSHSIWVEPAPENVCTRFLFAYQSSGCAGNANLEDEKFLKPIRAVLAKHIT